MAQYVHWKSVCFSPKIIELYNMECVYIKKTHCPKKEVLE